jgi:Uma2 family endonuclease
MATSALIPLSEYLRTSYRPDCDWIDGEVKERNVGEGQHASVQKFLIRFLGDREEEFGFKVWPEQRVQTSETHFRVPDVCVCDGSAPFERIVRVPPVLCIEILSWEDRMADMQDRVSDYLGMGVKTVWLIDPRRRNGFLIHAGEQIQVEVLTVPGTGIRVELSRVFAELDKLEGKAL